MWIKDHQTEGNVIQEISPRSYVVHTPDGKIRINRRQLIQLPKENDDKKEENGNSDDKIAGTEEREKNAENHATEERGNDTEETQIEDSTPTVEEEQREDHKEREAEQHVLPRECTTGVQTRRGRCIV